MAAVVRKADIRPGFSNLRVVVFDLDACCWWPEMYLLRGSSPFVYDVKTGLATSSRGRGEVVKLMGCVREVCVLAFRRWADVPWPAQAWASLHQHPTIKCGIASRCDEPEWAHELLGLFQVKPGVTMRDVCAYTQIHKGSKKKHLEEIRRAAGCAMSEILFFDDDDWNISQVSELGVKCVLTPNGVTAECWAEGLALFGLDRID